MAVFSRRPKRGDAAALSDTTVDEFGPKPVAKDDPDTKDVNEQAQYVQKYQPGLFIKNAVKRPGLCSVGAAANVDNVKIGDQTVSILKGQNSGPPGMSVRALGSGFGAAKGASGLWFGGLAGQVNRSAAMGLHAGFGFFGVPVSGFSCTGEGFLRISTTITNSSRKMPMPTANSMTSIGGRGNALFASTATLACPILRHAPAAQAFPSPHAVPSGTGIARHRPPEHEFFVQTFVTII